MTNYYEDILPPQPHDVFRYALTDSTANAIGIVFGKVGIHRDSLYSGIRLSSFDVIRLFIAKWLKRKEVICGDVIVFCHALYDNYYHFMLECLPRLFCLRNDMARGTGCIIVPDVGSSFHSQWLEILGLESAIRRVAINNIVVAERVIVCSFQSNSGNHNRTIILEYRNWLFESVRNFREYASIANNNLPNKIFVGRKAGKRRTIVNIEQVIRFLSTHGYSYIEIDDLSIIEQVSIFHNSESIVAIHGAALANIIFCKRHTKILELINKELNYYTFSKLSSILDLRHRRVPCEPVSHSDEPAVINHCNIIVDCGELARAILQQAAVDE